MSKYDTVSSMESRELQMGFCWCCTMRNKFRRIHLRIQMCTNAIFRHTKIW